jgi:nucleosome binding factor SPN SPT16 subunit
MFQKASKFPKQSSLLQGDSVVPKKIAITYNAYCINMFSSIFIVHSVRDKQNGQYADE